MPAVNIDTDRARLHAEALRNTYPRPEGSEGERRAAQYIETVLQPLDVDYIVRDFTDLDEGHSFSQIVDISVPGRSPETVLLLVPLGHADEVSPDNDGSASLAASLALVESLGTAVSNLSYRIVLLGAAQGQAPRYPLGTRFFLRDYFPESDVLALYLTASQPGLTLETGGGGSVAPSWLVTARRAITCW